MDAQGFQIKDLKKVRAGSVPANDAVERDFTGQTDTGYSLSPEKVSRLSGATPRWLLADRRRFLAAVLRKWLQAEVLLTEVVSPGTVPQQYTDGASVAELQMTSPTALHFGTEGLAAIIEDVWSAERHLQPDFDVAVLYASGTSIFRKPQDVLGVMTASARPTLGGVYIQGLAIHPNLLGYPAGFLKASGLLVEAGIDVSLKLGMRGWVMSHVDDVHAVIWRTLGFSRKSGPLFQRMGYFDRQPIEGPHR
ncbi:hypothetical protein [Alicyclobacillus ferrooxydans]|uniref:Uncharacterized protein n=1 Tax=Alicyclobacillus ferrooxydans TaxID=471514 RepID=A0A0P9ELS9_9BACL|nr:hypothetical protein [Alicyclobacillus ferrooxydans]KPV44256.1 hypothetical protein AN477_08145 [Alicyclobacillus ferrooxydans]